MKVMKGLDVLNMVTVFLLSITNIQENRKQHYGEMWICRRSYNVMFVDSFQEFVLPSEIF